MKFFKNLLESLPNYRKIVFSRFLIQNDKKLLREIGFSKNDINRLNLEFKKILLQEHENYLDFSKNEKESVIEKFLNK